MPASVSDDTAIYATRDVRNSLQGDISAQHVSGIDLEKQVVCRAAHFPKVPNAAPLNEGRPNRCSDILTGPYA